ncbi:MAG: PQQ-binding-like beta-propeller repeat protein [Planctomycetes bacterium]|nr:PQQ-binding-like beta-propeller repeat protein [Planctomycetota bacterium]
MNRLRPQLAFVAFLALLAGADWPQFRGPGNSSVAENDRLPTEWSENQNVVWRVELPGRGPSSPIIVSDRVFVTATTGVKHDRLHVLCFDADSGKRLWEREFWATGRTATHDSISGAAPTPASDGQRVFAFFSSNDLVCLDLDGNLQWYRGLSYDYPKSGNDVGMASSPAVIDGAVIVQVESQGDSFAVAIDTATGENLWKVPRKNRANWASPIALPGRGGRGNAVLLQSPSGLTAHDPRTGEQRWSLENGCASMCSSLFHDNLLLVPMSGLTALRFSDASNAPEILWDSRRLSPGTPSPVVYQDRVYTVSGAIVKCGELATGDVIWQLRLEGTHWATPVIAGGKMYCINYDGRASVIRLGDEEGEVVGQADLGQKIHASPAVADNAMYVRSDRYLWKIGER